MIQTNFSGGMNLFDDSLLIGADQYGFAQNVRNRNGGLTPIKAPLEDTTAPVGPKQGLYGFDKYLVLFCNGNAYYKDIITGGAWTLIADLVVSPTETIYVAAVPASTTNVDRKLKVSTQSQGNTTDSGVNFDSSLTVNGTESGLVVQDGISQPWLIKPDGTARRLGKYSEWKRDRREYVPVMKQMCFINNKLFGMSPDGTKLYSSVSGRPLDFVVNVGTTGDKGGDADTTAYSVTYEPATFLGVLGRDKIMIGTANRCYPITLDYNRLIFAEPYYLNTEHFAAGVVNQISFLPVVREQGFMDYYFVAPDGLRTYLTANSDQNEGRNSMFSLMLGSSIGRQSTSCCMLYDDYAFFSIKTTYSATNYVAVFDIKRQQWVAFDVYDIGAIIQFAVADQNNVPVLYAITSTKVYKLFSHTDYAQATVNFRAEFSGDAGKQLSIKSIRAVFLDGNIAGTVSAYEVGDSINTIQVEEDFSGVATENFHFNFASKAKQYFRSQTKLSWSTNAKLQVLQTEHTIKTFQIPLQQQSRNY